MRKINVLLFVCVDAPQVFFTVVHNRHWAVVVVNITGNEFNVFDSIKNLKDVFEMERITKDVVMHLLEWAQHNFFNSTYTFMFLSHTVHILMCSIPCILFFPFILMFFAVLIRSPTSSFAMRGATIQT